MKQQIKINTNKVIGRPNPKMWGIFFEEINHAGDGGLYAEQIRNRNFTESNLPESTIYSAGQVLTKNGHTENFDLSDTLPGWKLKLFYGADGTIKKVVDNTRNMITPEQLKLSLYSAGNGARLINSGYYGFSVDKTGYHGFIIVKSEKLSNITVGMMYKNGIVITSTEINGICSDYKKLEFTLEGVEAKNSRFFIEIKEEGELFIDFVSLFPNNTYAGRKYGFRNDLMQMLIDMKPGFLRFPGGCVVEGINLQNAIHWKETIGAIENRRGHWNLWGYRCTDGLGMHEFLQLCEDLDSEAMYVCNCGMSCQCRGMEHAEGEELQHWLTDALDAIEYCIGTIDTRWGAERAKNGHPKPFKLRYVEIGNENRDNVYFERYKIFYHAIHEKYPHLELISNCLVPDAKNDIVDDHYYSQPQYMPQIFNKYESFNKNSHNIYIGEYACNKDVGYGNLLSSISEACFMVGMERSCDVVRIASYAPLLCNENDRKWPVNLINFDKDTAYALPSYYVQKLFAENNPERVVETILQLKDGYSHLYASSGLIGNELVIKVACFGTEDITADISVSGVNLDKNAKEFIVSGENETDTNSVVSPFEVCTIERAKALRGNIITHTFPACSFTLFRIRTL